MSILSKEALIEFKNIVSKIPDEYSIVRQNAIDLIETADAALIQQAEMQLEIDRLRGENLDYEEELKQCAYIGVERDRSWREARDLKAELSTLRGALEAKAAEWDRIEADLNSGDTIQVDVKWIQAALKGTLIRTCGAELSALAQSVPTKPQVSAGEGKNDI